VAQYQTVTQQLAQPIVQAVAQPVAQYQTIAQPVAQYQTVAQPVVQTVAQPYVSTIGAVAQPFGISQLQAYRSIAQPVVGVAQTYRSIAQPSVFAVQPQQQVVLGSGSLLNSGVLRQDITRQAGLGGVSFLSARSQPLGSISYSRTYAETERK
jgi:hypothetical protein